MYVAQAQFRSWGDGGGEEKGEGRETETDPKREIRLKKKSSSDL